MMLYVYTDLETSLKRNQERFNKSKGQDRSLNPNIVIRTWNEITKNFNIYKQMCYCEAKSHLLDAKPLSIPKNILGEPNSRTNPISPDSGFQNVLCFYWKYNSLHQIVSLRH